MKKLWRADYGTPRPVAVGVPLKVQFGFSRDANGETIFSNTHFELQEDAWQNLLANVDAGESLALRALQELETRIERARLEVIEATKVRHDTREAFSRRNEPEVKP